jgi:hypothetical protein
MRQDYGLKTSFDVLGKFFALVGYDACLEIAWVN